MDNTLAPAVIASLGRQLRQLQSTPPEGVRLSLLEASSLQEIFAEIQGPTGTPYDGGVYRLKLVLGSEYPAVPPKGYFLTRIFHPNVALNGDICVNTLKRDWTPDTTISHILQVIRCLLIVPFPESSLNDEAGKLFMESYDEYYRKASLWTSIHAAPLAGSAFPATSTSTASSRKDTASSLSRNTSNSGSSNSNVSSRSTGVATGPQIHPSPSLCASGLGAAVDADTTTPPLALEAAPALSMPTDDQASNNIRCGSPSTANGALSDQPLRANSAESVLVKAVGVGESDSRTDVGKRKPMGGAFEKGAEKKKSLRRL